MPDERFPGLKAVAICRLLDELGGVGCSVAMIALALAGGRVAECFGGRPSAEPSDLDPQVDLPAVL